MTPKTISEMTSQEIFEAVESGMADISRLLESGELDGSGRYYTDAELAAGAATGGVRPAPRAKKASAA